MLPRIAIGRESPFGRLAILELRRIIALMIALPPMRNSRIASRNGEHEGKPPRTYARAARKKTHIAADAAQKARGLPLTLPVAPGWDRIAC